MFLKTVTNAYMGLPIPKKCHGLFWPFISMVYVVFGCRLDTKLRVNSYVATAISSV